MQMWISQLAGKRDTERSSDKDTYTYCLPWQVSLNTPCFVCRSITSYIVSLSASVCWELIQQSENTGWEAEGWVPRQAERETS